VAENLIFLKTASKKGRTLFATPKNSPLRYLSCGRIILDQEVDEVQVNPERQEVGLICIDGEGIVSVEGETFILKKFDALYIPSGKIYGVKTNSTINLAECLAPSENNGNVHFISFEELKKNPELAIQSGDANYRRMVYKHIDKNVPASRLLAGITLGEPGNWTSWTPHEHARSKEEVYLYIDMPYPAYGIQLMYDDEKEIDFATRVFQDDAVVIHKGYHPNVGVPGYGIKFVWMMAAFRPEIDRDWSDMRYERGFLS